MAEEAGDRSAFEGRVRRAVRELSTHPSVVAAGPPEPRQDGSISVVVEVESNLPTHWRAKGQSDNGVRAVEPVTFEFFPAHPLVPPRITLRNDFDRSHPHLQPRRSGIVEPCLVYGSVAEVLQARGMLGLVEQLVAWLEKAATTDLIDPRQGWEPTRRDSLLDILAVDRRMLEDLVGKDEGGQAFATRFGGLVDGRALGLRVSRERARIDAKTFDGSYRREEETYSGSTITLVCWSGRLASGTPFVADRYVPEDVTDLASLYVRARALGCTASLSYLLGLLDRIGNTRKRLPVPVGIILLARRPYPMIDTGSPIEVCSYVLEYRAGDDFGPDSAVPIRLAAQRDEMSRSLLRSASGDDSGDGAPWSLVGCGSVGSKLALHLARSGRPPGIVVDRAVIAPHNYGRHALLPVLDTDHLGFTPKAQTLSTALSSLGMDVRAAVEDVVTSGAVRRKAFWREGAGMLVNATGSLVVREALASMAVGTCRPPAVEACLLASGKVAYLTVEGRAGNPSTDDLAAEAYRLLAADDRLAGPVFAAEAQAVAVGQGCSSVTFPMADSLLSAMTASMAMRLAEVHSAGMPMDGEVMLGRLSGDGYGQEWRREAVPPFKTVVATDGWTCSVSARVVAMMRADIVSRPGVETGGVIVGRWSEVTRRFCVIDLIPPPSDSVFSRTEFVLGVAGLRKVIGGYVSRCGGSLLPLGTWHSHLRPSGPSAKDFATGALMAGLQVAPAFMVVCAPDRFHAFVTEVDTAC